MAQRCYLVNIPSLMKRGLKLSRRHQFSSSTLSPSSSSLLEFSPKCDEGLRSRFAEDMRVLCDFISPEEEKSLMDELEMKFKRVRYQFDHWDDVRSWQS